MFFSVAVEVLLGEPMLEFLEFVLVLFDLVFFFDEELLKGLHFFPKFFLLIVGVVLVLDGLLELGLEYDEFVECLILFLLDFPVDFGDSPQLII